jgi:hypothetical protein
MFNIRKLIEKSIQFRSQPRHIITNTLILEYNVQAASILTIASKDKISRIVDFMDFIKTF